MNNFLTRTITAIIFAAASIAAIYFEGYIHAYFLLFTSIALIEYFKMLGNKKRKSINQLYVLFGIVSYVTFALTQQQKISTSFVYLPILFFVIVNIIELYLKDNHPFENIAIVLTSFLYVVLPFSLYTHLGYLQSSVYNFEIPMGLLFLIWANDSGAYLFGITLGKNRLFERISPKKSWEGFFGGLIIAILTAYILSSYFNSIERIHWIVISIIVVVIGTYGDLVESMLKRSKGIKDSGSFMPGHGGALDRFDALLLAAPMVYLYLHLFL